MALRKIAVLGCGLVGSAIAKEISSWENTQLKVIDKNPKALQSLKTNLNCDCFEADFSDAKRIKELISDMDYVVSAVPGFLGLQMLRTCIEAKKNVVDIAFMPEDPSVLNELAIQHGVNAIVDCGVAPGMSNILLAHAGSQLDEFDTGKIFVGGLPQKREKPWEYKAVFSPVDVIEEYTRPARFLLNKKIVEKEALSDIEVLYFNETGPLEAFNTDGLRSLLYTLKANNLIEKTLRYPGYIDKIKVLKDSGFFNNETIRMDDKEVNILEFTSKILFDDWKLGPEDEDFTVMRIIAEGKKGNEKLRIGWDLFDTYEQKSGIHSMARTTGYTATSVLKLRIEGARFNPGVIFPEQLCEYKGFVAHLLSKLKEKQINYNEFVEQIK